MAKHPVQPGPETSETAADLQKSPDRMSGPDPVRTRSFRGTIRITFSYAQDLMIFAPMWANQTLRAAGCWWDRNSQTWRGHLWELPAISRALTEAGYVVHEDDESLPGGLRQAARRAAIREAIAQAQSRPKAAP